MKHLCFLFVIGVTVSGPYTAAESERAPVGEYSTFRGADVALTLVPISKNNLRAIIESRSAPLLLRSHVFDGGVLGGAEFLLTYDVGKRELRWPVSPNPPTPEVQIVRLPQGGFVGRDFSIREVEQSLKESGQWPRAGQIIRQFPDAKLSVRVLTTHFSGPSLYPSYKEGYREKDWIPGTSGRYRHQDTLQSVGLGVALTADEHLQVVGTVANLNAYQESVQLDHQDGKRSVAFRFAVATDDDQGRLKVRIETHNSGEEGVAIFDPFRNEELTSNSTAISLGKTQSELADITSRSPGKLRSAECVDWYWLGPGYCVGRNWNEYLRGGYYSAVYCTFSVKKSILGPCPWTGLPVGGQKHFEVRTQFLREASKSERLLQSDPIQLRESND